MIRERHGKGHGVVTSTCVGGIVVCGIIGPGHGQGVGVAAAVGWENMEKIIASSDNLIEEFLRLIGLGIAQERIAGCIDDIDIEVVEGASDRMVQTHIQQARSESGQAEVVVI